MNTLHRLRSLRVLQPAHALSFSALAASLLLAACGGGSGEAPPALAGGTADTAGPVITITDSVAATDATGDVTFTFAFNEDVGTSFTVDDVTVTGGTKGAFTRLSGTRATLVVVPTPDATGTIALSIAAGAVSDARGNTNAIVNSQQAYNTVIPPEPGNTGTCTATTCTTFSGAGIGFSPFENQGGGTVEIADDPNAATNRVVKFVKKPGDGDFFGTVITGLATPVTLTNANHTVTLRVLTPTAGTNFLLKFEGGPGGAATEVDVVTTQANKWETLSFVLPGRGTFTTVVLFPNGRSSVGTAKTMYVDELKFPVVAAAGGGGAPVTILSFDEATAPKLTPFGVNGAPPVIAADPTNAGNKVLQIFKYRLPAPGSEQWAGVTVSTGANDSIPRIPFTATAQTMTLRVYSPAVGVRVRLKVEDATNNGISCETDAITTTAGAWETLTFNFAAPGSSPPVGGGPTSPLDLTKNYTKASIFMDFGIGKDGSAPLPADRVYYADDLAFVGAATPGGGGGGAAGGAPVVFSSGFGATTTVQGGAYGGYSGSSVDGFNCGAPATCGSGGSFAPAVAAADSGFYYFYQTPTPVTSLYAGIYVQAPGLTTGLSGTADTAGVSIAGKTSMSFTFGQNPEWFNGPAKNFGVILTLGKFYNVGSVSAPAACNIKLLAVVTPTAQAPTRYTLALSGFTLIQTCNVSGLTPASALALGPLSQVDFQAVGSGNPLPPNDGRLVGANMSVATGTPAVYPTTLVVNGGISFE